MKFISTVCSTLVLSVSTTNAFIVATPLKAAHLTSDLALTRLAAKPSVDKKGAIDNINDMASDAFSQTKDFVKHETAKINDAAEEVKAYVKDTIVPAKDSIVEDAEIMIEDLNDQVDDLADKTKEFVNQQVDSVTGAVDQIKKGDTSKKSKKKQSEIRHE